MAFSIAFVKSPSQSQAGPTFRYGIGIEMAECRQLSLCLNWGILPTGSRFDADQQRGAV